MTYQYLRHGHRGRKLFGGLLWLAIGSAFFFVGYGNNFENGKLAVFIWVFIFFANSYFLFSKFVSLKRRKVILDAKNIILAEDQDFSRSIRLDKIESIDYKKGSFYKEDYGSICLRMTGKMTPIIIKNLLSFEKFKKDLSSSMENLSSNSKDPHTILSEDPRNEKELALVRLPIVLFFLFLSISYL